MLGTGWRVSHRFVRSTADSGPSVWPQNLPCRLNAYPVQRFSNLCQSGASGDVSSHILGEAPGLFRPIPALSGFSTSVSGSTVMSINTASVI